ncbi:hypothetical protein CXG50_00245 [Pseudomonas plecoglossicida]|jgi:hypothetical protein|uniref:SSU ribosomal protein S2p (SAe) n=1 Tax=Pseudomonas plecoglossicida TaxID=70775 RepID=A0ABX4U5D2_PSEDL|nr:MULTISPECIES: hypothetical protein [Pseudomonas]KXK70841.1 hypothetical protein BC89_11185 [Pseudomonas monteilii]AGA75667.1 hypothetical protein B479_23890 [Pseudomonas putida HB3267]MCE0751264.1 hypothetical protein [Pseudomonas asiatica]MCE0941908.1 hypothetical protein [Pseudomonas asiatica]MCE0952531.1 hypothetical protein [Pseudomonas asiatica]
MSEARSFINPQAQSYESLKASTPMSANQRAKFDVLNAHIVNSVVVGGELVIVGDPSTPSCTSHEAYLMAEAAGIHHQLEINGAGVDDFFLDNYEMLKGLLSHTSMGAGVVSDGWSRYLDAIKRTLEEIEILHREYLKNGTLKARDEFYAKRMALFMKLEGQLNNMAAYGSGLQNKGSVKRALEISTKSYLHTGEIAGYAEKIAGVSKAASLIKKGTYIGLGLDVASTGLSIHHACTFGRSEDCRKAKYVEGVSLVGSTGGSIAGGSIGGFLGGTGCVLFLGVTTGGPGALACTVIGGAVGGAAGGSVVGDIGEMFGELLYEVTQ